MIEWRSMKSKAEHGCRALLRVRGLAWGAGDGDDLRVVAVTRVHQPGEKPFWNTGYWGGPVYYDGDERLTGWLLESDLLKLGPRAWRPLTDEQIAQFWPDAKTDEEKADLREQWRACEEASRVR